MQSASVTGILGGVSDVDFVELIGLQELLGDVNEELIPLRVVYGLVVDEEGVDFLSSEIEEEVVVGMLGNEGAGEKALKGVA